MQKTTERSCGSIFQLASFQLFQQYLISGGTIGLFTGLSLISVVELAFWIYKTIKQYFAAACSKRKVRA